MSMLLNNTLYQSNFRPVLNTEIFFLDDLPEFSNWNVIGTGIEGTFSTVYQVAPKGRSVSTRYALKMLNSQWSGTLMGESVLKREMEIGIAISDPHLLPVLDCQQTRFGGNHDGLSDHTRKVLEPGYIVSPWLQGQTIQDLLIHRNSINLRCVLRIGQQIAKGLDTLHQNGWIHNDIKPANLFLSPSGHVTVLDFGLAECYPVSSPEKSLNPMTFENFGFVSGTPNYIAPERLRHFPVMTPQSDIFSLGLVLFEMIFGGIFPRIDSCKELVNRQNRISEHYLEDYEEQLGLLPKSLSALLISMTAKDYTKRPQSAYEIYTGLLETEWTLAETVSSVQ